MRTDSFSQVSRRAARMHWWRQVVDRPATANWDEVFDEAVSLRFQIGEAVLRAASDNRMTGLQRG